MGPFTLLQVPTADKALSQTSPDIHIPIRNITLELSLLSDLHLHKQQPVSGMLAPTGREGLLSLEATQHYPDWGSPEESMKFQ